MTRTFRITKRNQDGITATYFESYSTQTSIDRFLDHLLRDPSVVTFEEITHIEMERPTRPGDDEAYALVSRTRVETAGQHSRFQVTQTGEASWPMFSPIGTDPHPANEIKRAQGRVATVHDGEIVAIGGRIFSLRYKMSDHGHPTLEASKVWMHKAQTWLPFQKASA